eukprot:Plantae.Rhodophyta-Purpureofilum_apyrenoidigerum.ctg16796.p1 GENE.Plantae.Rhodophyta-Purpureofilum_apyrenoidigerum.ctg16796~~Plantae.Rhodophyta-Purpureofilum_apyrenoidigerum.ctg16796.p1  ORF type:complete len:347 (-),score=60.98 Plantae.Rhodophyta-Purpureofilum_apyrenoidigerum.ctg16796:209-1249(-)
MAETEPREKKGVLRWLWDFAFATPHTAADEVLDRKYTPSHTGFYPQFFKGLRCAWQGIDLTRKNPELRRRMTKAVPVVVGLGGIVVLLLTTLSLFLESAEKAGTTKKWMFFATRYANYVSLIAVFLLDKKLTVDDKVFFDTIQSRSPQFSAALQKIQKPKVFKTMVRLKVRRLVRMVVFHVVTKVVQTLFPSWLGMMVSPLIKIYVLRPILGTGVAVAVAAATFFPSDEYWDELVLIASEILMDSYSFGCELLDPYCRRVGSDQAIYVKKRYYGYITGMGLAYSLISRIPLLSPAAVICGEVGAAVLLMRLTGINQTKSPAMEIFGEEFVDPIYSAGESDVQKKVQ